MALSSDSSDGRPRSPALSPASRQNLADELADRVRNLIQAEGFGQGDRLPSIAEMARQFRVGHPTLREGLKKLETLGIVAIRHGSGVYVARDQDSLLVVNPVFSGSLNRKLLLDLIESRIPIELAAVRLAAARATTEQLDGIQEVLAETEMSLGDEDGVLTRVNMAFHRRIAAVSGNAVLGQLLEVLTELFHEEQRAILNIYGSRRKNFNEHIEIYEALRMRNPDLAAARMLAHLEGVREVLLRWNAEALPLKAAENS